MKKIRVIALVVLAMLLVVGSAQALTIENITYDNGSVSWTVKDFSETYDVYIDGTKSVAISKNAGKFKINLADGGHTLSIIDFAGNRANANFIAGPVVTPTIPPIEPTPTAPAAQTIKITKAATKTVYLGTKYTVEVTGKTIKSTKSSAKKVATMAADGTLTLKNAGSAKITITLTNKKTIKLTLKVVDPTAVTKVKLNKSGTQKLKVGKTLQLVPTITVPTKTEANQKVTWSSSKKSVATVDENGLVTAKKAGTATITVKSNNGKKATVKIKVSK